MRRNWDAWLTRASLAPSSEEREGRDRAEAIIRQAIEASALAPGVRVYVKGSHANGTNLKATSDVDIGVEWTRDVAVDLFSPSGHRPKQAPVQLTPGIDGDAFREQVTATLRGSLGKRYVHVSGDKAIVVSGIKGTPDSDVVAAQTLRRVDYDDHGRRSVMHTGSRVFTRGGGYVDNWPRQQRDNIANRDRHTSQRFTAVIRALKAMNHELVRGGYLMLPLQSYLIESLIWQVPKDVFGGATVVSDIANACTFLEGPLRRDLTCKDWAEICDLHYLFRPDQQWSRAEAAHFVDQVLACLAP